MYADRQSRAMIENVSSNACSEPRLVVMDVNMLRLTDANLTNDIQRQLV